MPRRGIIQKRKLQPDPFYNSTLVSRIISLCLKQGKKTTAERIVYGAMNIMKEKINDDPLKALEKAMENVRPLLETKSRRVGGANYQVPIEISQARSYSLAIRWVLKYASERTGTGMEGKLAAELLDALNNRGGAVKKREDTHKMAEANRAYAHYKW